MKIEIWHYEKHDTATVTEVAWHNEDIRTFLKYIKEQGGLLDGDRFIPWHRINYIKVADE